MGHGLWMPYFVFENAWQKDKIEWGCLILPFRLLEPTILCYPVEWPIGPGHTLIRSGFRHDAMNKHPDRLQQRMQTASGGYNSVETHLDRIHN